MPTIKDIARAADVSVTTVSYVLNNKGSISEETRQQVLRVVEEMGYTRSIRARNLREQQSRTIGYAQAANRSALNPVMDKLLYELVRLVEPEGRNLLLFSANADSDIHIYRGLVDSQRVDGFVLSYTNKGDKRFAFLHEVQVPFVAFGRSFTPLDDMVHWVDVDGEAGIYAAAMHLLAQGHRRIALLTWPGGSTAGDARTAGYAKALGAYGLALEDQAICYSQGGVENGYAGAERLLAAAAEPPTAIVAAEDNLALGALRYCTERGLRIAITGFDDVPAGALVQPSLTTLRQPTRHIGEVALGVMLTRIAQRDLPPRDVRIPCELVVRESCGAKGDR